LATSTKLGATIVRIQNAIASNAGSATGPGMGRLSTLSAANLQAIVVALNQTPGTPPAPSLDGATIYANNCAGCHGPLATSSKKGLTLARFTAAVTTNSATTGMGYLSTLTTAQVEALIAVLPAVTPTPGVTPTYANTCATCHGPLATSPKAGKSASAISAAIAANTGGMGSLSTLTATDIANIAAELATVAPPPPPVGGAALYAANCAGCHGALASSTKGGATLARIQAGIAANPVAMGSFATTLTTQQLTDIATALAAVVPSIPTDGPGLYTFYCASCHGALASSTKGGATAAKILATINSTVPARATAMGTAPLKALTTAQIDLIAAALSTITPPACGSCHNVTPTTLTSRRHALHLSTTGSSLVNSRFPAADQRCGTCHGVGYTSTTNVAATHNDGVVDIAANAATAASGYTGAINWVPPVRNASGAITTAGTCTPQCHGKKSW
jgi:mono/diheme cytochrome c family protein